MVRVQIYHYTLYDVEGSYREDTGRMALRDDNAARAFGKAIIRDVMSGDAARYDGWTMKVTKGSRAVCSLPLEHRLTVGAGGSIQSTF
jgi:hypothetical protein